MATIVPSNPVERRKFFIVIAITALCLGWLLFYTATHVNWRGPAKELNTPGWKLVKELNAQLNAETAFDDVGLAVAQEKPLKFRVLGAVYSQEDLDRLPARLKELKPDAEFEINVEIIKK